MRNPFVEVYQSIRNGDTLDSLGQLARMTSPMGYLGGLIADTMRNSSRGRPQTGPSAGDLAGTAGTGNVPYGAPGSGGADSLLPGGGYDYDASADPNAPVNPTLPDPSLLPNTGQDLPGSRSSSGAGGAYSGSSSLINSVGAQDRSAGGGGAIHGQFTPKVDLVGQHVAQGRHGKVV